MPTIDDLRAEAEALGLSIHHRTGKAKLEAMIAAAKVDIDHIPESVAGIPVTPENPMADHIRQAVAHLHGISVQFGTDTVEISKPNRLHVCTTLNQPLSMIIRVAEQVNNS